jgi:hypothetical protein
MRVPGDRGRERAFCELRTFDTATDPLEPREVAIRVERYLKSGSGRALPSSTRLRVATACYAGTASTMLATEVVGTTRCRRKPACSSSARVLALGPLLPSGEQQHHQIGGSDPWKPIIASLKCAAASGRFASPSSCPGCRSHSNR